MKIAKGEWDRFWAALGSDWYYDDSDAPDDTSMSAEDMITFSAGCLFYQGDRHAEPRAVPGIFTKTQVAEAQRGHSVFYDLAAAIRRWRKSQNMVTFAVECPKDKEGTIRDLIKNNGGKVL